jgi:hypothetical protein
VALTPQLRASQAFVTALTGGGTPAVEVSQAYVTAIANFPTERVEVSQAFALAMTGGGTPAVEVSQAYVVVLASGRVDDPRVRAWAFTLDGHDFYVLRLGESETLVYDTYAQEWYVWGSGTGALWRAYTGTNWIGGRSHALNWSNVIVGDDGNGSLYFLSPDDDTDDDAIFGDDTPRAFTRQATGQLVIKAGYASVPCFGVQLMGSIGSGADDLTVNLQVSDDRGNTYTDCGDITLDGDEYTARVNWLSLGSMVSPGRLFKITDTGALKRIDWLESDG